MTKVISPLQQLEDIRRTRSTEAVVAIVSAVITGQLLFACFVLGYTQGAGPRRLGELVLGMGIFLGFSVLAAGPSLKRRRRKGAKQLLKIQEGNKRRAVEVHDNYLIIDGEIVVFGSLTKVERNGEQLLVRYHDPLADGPVLREFEGHGRAIDRLSDVLIQAYHQPKASLN